MNVHMAKVHAYFDEHAADWVTFTAIVSGHIRSQFNFMSLRLIEYVCTRYAAQRPAGVFYKHKGQLIELNSAYSIAREHLKLHQMDPFQRTQRVDVTKHDITAQTTNAQLSFFAWAFQHGVIQYILTRQTTLGKYMRKHGHTKQPVKDEQAHCVIGSTELTL